MKTSKQLLRKPDLHTLKPPESSAKEDPRLLDCDLSTAPVSVRALGCTRIHTHTHIYAHTGTHLLYLSLTRTNIQAKVKPICNTITLAHKHFGHSDLKADL